jgi:hypothetical protein
VVRPGEDLVIAGLEDLRRGAETPAALLVAMGAARLTAAGLEVPPAAFAIPDPERRLYEVLAAEDADSAHGRYNALVRRLVSYERALECVP